MAILKNVRSYLLEEEFKINYFKNKVNIVNYTDIAHFDNNKILINYSDGVVSIGGKNLFVSKLLCDELLIEGSIEKIEFR